MAPLWLGGIRGKQSTPSDWLGGIGVVSTVGKWERRGAGSARSAGSSFEAGEKAAVCSLISRIDCNMTYVGIRISTVNVLYV